MIHGIKGRVILGVIQCRLSNGIEYLLMQVPIIKLWWVLTRVIKSFKYTWRISVEGIKTNPSNIVECCNLFEFCLGKVNMTTMSTHWISIVLKNLPCDTRIALHVIEKKPSSKNHWIKQNPVPWLTREECP